MLKMRRKTHRRLIWQLVLMTAAAGSFGFSLVPLYRVLCVVTGFGDQKALAERAVVQEAPDANRLVTVEFVGNLPTYGSWEFRPSVNSMQVHPGRLYTTTFFARNLLARDTTAQAVPSIAPDPRRRISARPNVSASPRSTLPSMKGGTWRCASSSIRRCRAIVDRLSLAYTFYELPRVAAR